MNQVQWKSATTEVFLNPRMPLEQQSRITQAVAELKIPASIWLQSSGTESGVHGIKMICLSKEAVLAAAKSVNNFLGFKEKDKWANPLPSFHIGGLSISARCLLAGAVELKWNHAWDPDSFYQWLGSTHASFTSLVPTQLYDLVRLKKASPPQLKAILLGGGALDPTLWQQANELGWPVIPSYGMTETSAVIAARPLGSTQEFGQLQLLPHVQLSEQREGRFAVEGPSLFTGYLFLEEGQSPRWADRPLPFVLDDLINIRQDGWISILGRQSQLVKILGETVNLVELSHRLKKQFAREFELIALPDARRGYTLVAFYESRQQVLTVEQINSAVMPFERVTELIALLQFPRTHLGKINRSELVNKLKIMK